MGSQLFTSGSQSIEGNRLTIVNCIPQEIGWSPIQHMVRLATQLLGASLLSHASGSVSFARKALSLLTRRRARGESSSACLLVCRGPADLIRLLEIPGWKRRYNVLGAWIIDSFWLEHTPSYIRVTKPFDHLFVTSLEDVDEWQRTTDTPTTWLPWGSDVLRLGSDRSEREWDIVRVGRQPAQWDDDQAAGAAAEAVGLKYRGRPARSGVAPTDNQRALMSVYANAKFLLAFSNLANPESYTHPRRDYLTGRWTDALACGATVAGVPPRGLDAQQLLWPGATLDLGTVRRKEGLDMLLDAARAWTPDVARRNHARALERLDWRRRFDTIARVMRLARGSLDPELEHLESRMDALGGSGGRDAAGRARTVDTAENR